MANSSDVVVSLKDVQQTFHVGEETVTPLNEVNFELKDNTFNIVYGPSGSGKSTLLNVLSGLQRPTKGTVEFDGREVYGLKPDELAYFRANRLGFVYQTNYWIKSLNVQENVAMSLYFMGHARGSAAKMAKESLEQINMGEYAKKYPAMLSGGEQQRVAMARALATNPKFVIADEPTGALDSKSGDMIIDLLRTAQTEHGRTVILVTHNMEYLPLADHLLHIQDGHVQELDANSIHETTETLMKDMKARIDRLAGMKHGKS